MSGSDPRMRGQESFPRPHHRWGTREELLFLPESESCSSCCWLQNHTPWAAPEKWKPQILLFSPVNSVLNSSLPWALLFGKHKSQSDFKQQSKWVMQSGDYTQGGWGAVMNERTTISATGVKEGLLKETKTSGKSIGQVKSGKTRITERDQLTCGPWGRK